MRKSLLALGLMAATSTPAMAADYSDGDIHKNDFKFLQFNLMAAVNEKGTTESTHDYLEMEFGGRSGIFDLYGYVDVFNLTSDPGSDKAGAEKMFMKFAPRASLDAMTGVDLSFGPVQELFVASVVEWGGNSGINTQKIGLGSNVELPWFGTVGLNAYATYDSNNKDWNGYQVSTDWFKPFYFFDNGSFISYQGYIDYQFGMKEELGATASHGGAMFNGIYWHSDRYAVGYGLKAYHNVYGFEDGRAIPTIIGNPIAESSGIGHYFAVTYKF
ncbi:nucleoside-specific channel-forming Tsx family protein [Grimontia hollisae]|uniref:nucleoside-specific channel-forming Tsx family protein n=1 Tax=Grimontia hollisae TaxID=673 RepID=UPI000E02ADE0|nr:outer membrane protein OmpK [Grimontia hollisae]STQ76749.1 Nucleoside-specific channel-forming protein tsx precursor [Grimontia hollisae]